MKKRIMPALIAVVLIVLTIAIGFGSGIMEKYSYSDVRADLGEYFQVTSEDEAAIVLQDEIIEDKALVQNGCYYLPLDFVKAMIDDRFYYDYNENLLIYTLPMDSVTAISEDAGYTKDGQRTDTEYVITLKKDEKVYVAADYVKNFANFSYEAFTGPNRLQMYTTWGEQTVASIKKNTQVRVKGGIKSEILADVFEDEQVTILEKMETWTKVKTKDSIIGYVENKRLDKEEKIVQDVVMDVVAPEYTSLTKDYKINMVWHLVTNTTANGSVDGLLANTQNVNTISPTWFALSDNEGNISSLADASYVADMHNRGIEVWAMFDNFTNKEVSTVDVISYTSKRKILIQNLIGQVQTYGIDGINLDFEQIPQEAAEDYIQFIRELSVACRLNNVVLSVDNYVPTGYTEHYNRQEQGIFADYVVIMGYDEHWLGSDEAGSVASIDFVENGIVDTISVVPKEKVINALPFYTILWGSGETLTSKAYGMSAAEELLKSKGVNAQWDEVTCQNYGSYTEDGVNYQIWLEDETSIETKLNVMKKHEIGGVAGWRMGLEKQAVWDKITAFLQ